MTKLVVNQVVICTLKHDKYVEDLCRKIETNYDVVMKNVPLYSSRGRQVAEIDILAIKDEQCYVYEVKCSHRITKAKKQLYRIKRLLPDIKRLFFFCGESGRLTKIA